MCLWWCGEVVWWWVFDGFVAFGVMGGVFRCVGRVLVVGCWCVVVLLRWGCVGVWVCCLMVWGAGFGRWGCWGFFWLGFVLSC